MGGCRCTFRSCTNNSVNSPKMHFFHYPIRDQERVQKWAHISNNPQFLSLQESQLKNRVVCQEHFREHCFMNYLHDKLTKRAVPTLLKLETGEVLDFEVETDLGEEKQEDTNPTPSGSNTTLLLNKTKTVKQIEVIFSYWNFVAKYIILFSFFF